MDLTKQYQYPPQFHPCNNPLAQKSNNKQNKQTNKNLMRLYVDKICIPWQASNLP